MHRPLITFKRGLPGRSGGRAALPGHLSSVAAHFRFNICFKELVYQLAQGCEQDFATATWKDRFFDASVRTTMLCDLLDLILRQLHQATVVIDMTLACTAPQHACQRLFYKASYCFVRGCSRLGQTELNDSSGPTPGEQLRGHFYRAPQFHHLFLQNLLGFKADGPARRASDFPCIKRAEK